MGDPLAPPSSYHIDIEVNGTRWTATVALDPPWLDGQAQAPDGTELPVQGWLATSRVLLLQTMRVRLHLWLGANRLECDFVEARSAGAEMVGRPGYRVHAAAPQLAAAAAEHGRRSFTRLRQQADLLRQLDGRPRGERGLVHWQLAEVQIGVGHGFDGCQSARTGVDLLDGDLDRPGARQLLRRLIAQLERWPDGADTELRRWVDGTLSRLRDLDRFS